MSRAGASLVALPVPQKHSAAAAGYPASPWRGITAFVMVFAKKAKTHAKSYRCGVVVTPKVSPVVIFV
jgi:hypothetical protein